MTDLGKHNEAGRMDQGIKVERFKIVDEDVKWVAESAGDWRGVKTELKAVVGGQCMLGETGLVVKHRVSRGAVTQQSMCPGEACETRTKRLMC